MTARSFLVRGLLAGLIAGLAAFGVAFVVGEPSVTAAIALEEGGAADHAHATGTEHAQAEPAPAEEVPRPVQSTAGLLTATVVLGATLGGLVGVLSALALGRIGGLGPRGSTLVVVALGYLGLYVVPFVAYPPNPPGVGQDATIGSRTLLYLVAIAISLLALVAAVLTARALARRWGAWYGILAAAAGYLVIVTVAVVLLPAVDEIPTGFPAGVLYDFRLASFATQLTLWLVLGLVLAELVGRAVRTASASRPVLVDAAS